MNLHAPSSGIVTENGYENMVNINFKFVSNLFGKENENKSS